MNKELIQMVSESAIRLKFLLGSQFMKPIREIERECSELSPGYIHIMRWMMSKGNAPVSMTDLAASACISKPNLTTMVDRLISDGLVERSADANDRRVVNVSLTEAGIQFLYQYKVRISEFIESRLSLLGDSELENLKKALDDIVVILKILAEKQHQ
jgi:Transcriptional regulators